MADVVLNTDIKLPLTGYLKANGIGSVVTASATVPNTDVTGLGTMSTQNKTAVDIDGGNIDGTAIGAASASSAIVTTFAANYGKFSGAIDSYTSANAVNISYESNVGTISATRTGGNFSSLAFKTSGADGNGVTRFQLATNGAATFSVAGSTVAQVTSTGITVDGNTLSFGSGSTNAPYMQHTAATVDIKGGSTGGVRVLNNAGTIANCTFPNAGGANVTGAIDATTSVHAATFVDADKYVSVRDVYGLTAVTTASQTRSTDLANGQTQTVAANQNFTWDVTGPAGKAGIIELYVYNNGAGTITVSAGNGWARSAPSNAILTSTTSLIRVRWDGTKAWRLEQYWSDTTGDFRPT